MPHHEIIDVVGHVGDMFNHRFVIVMADGDKILADLGPKGAETIRLVAGAKVEASGEMKPSELKVSRISLDGRPAVEIAHKPKPHHDPKHNHDAKPDVAVKAVREAGFEPIGATRRRPKHFEVLARAGHAYVECHVEFDGHIRKEKVVVAHDPKWADAIAHVA